jgi:drug/metabolite transporter (DMT)-like permease
VTLAGVALISWTREARTGAGPRLAEGVALALLAALGGGLTATLIGAASSSGVLWLLLCQRATVAGLALAALATTGRTAAVPRASLPAICAIGVLDLAATAAFAAATAKEALSLVAVVGALYPVVTVALAFALLSERLRAHQAVGAAAALAGVAAIAA